VNIGSPEQGERRREKICCALGARAHRLTGGASPSVDNMLPELSRTMAKFDRVSRPDVSPFVHLRSDQRSMDMSWPMAWY